MLLLCKAAPARRLLAALCLILLGVACKPKAQDSQTLAIVSQDGQYALSLILMRNFFVPTDPDKYSDQDRLALENALRLQMGLVECRGDNAGPRLNFLEALAFKNPDAVRREGRNVYVMTTDQARLYEGCTVLGQHTMGGASLGAAFNESPQNSDDSLRQQAIWLAMRGKANLSSRTFALQFWKFMEETLGVVPTKNYAATAKSIDYFDRIYNPCVKSSAKSKWRKDKFFRCNKARNYEVVGDYQQIRRVVSSFIDQHEGEFLASISRQRDPQLKAYDVAYTTTATIRGSLGATLGKRDRATYGGLGLTQSNLDELDAPKNHPVVAYLKPRLNQFEKRLQVKISRQLSPVYSFSNPAPVHTPPAAEDMAKVKEDGRWYRSSLRDDQALRRNRDGRWQTRQIYQSGLPTPVASDRSWSQLGNEDGQKVWRTHGSETARFQVHDESGLIVRRSRNVDFDPQEALDRYGSWQYRGAGRSSISGGSNDDRSGATSEQSSRTNANDQKRQKYQKELGWDSASLGGMTASQYINQRGKTLPNIEHFTSGAYQALYRMGTRKYDEPRNGYNGTRFNCQDFTAAELQGFYEMTGIKGRAVSFSWDDKSEDSGRAHHAVVALPVGTDEQGRRLYVIKEPQWAPGQNSVSEPFVWEDRAKIYAKYSGHKGVTTYDHARTNGGDSKEYDPRVGAKSVVWSEQSTRDEDYEKVQRKDDAEQPLFVDGDQGAKELNWDFDPFEDNLAGGRKLQAEQQEQDDDEKIDWGKLMAKYPHLTDPPDPIEGGSSAGDGNLGGWDDSVGGGKWDGGLADGLSTGGNWDAGPSDGSGSWDGLSTGGNWDAGPSDGSGSWDGLSTGGKWDGGYTDGLSTGGKWDGGYTDGLSTGGKWDGGYNDGLSTGGKWDGGYNDGLSTGGNWDAGPSDGSGSWDGLSTDGLGNGGKWDGGKWDGGYTDGLGNGGKWDDGGSLKDLINPLDTDIDYFGQAKTWDYASKSGAADAGTTTTPYAQGRDSFSATSGQDYSSTMYGSSDLSLGQSNTSTSSAATIEPAMTPNTNPNNTVSPTLSE